MKKVLCFFGTRPEAIKMAPVIKELKKCRKFKVTVVVSAQHRHMLDQVLKIFNLKSQLDLNLMTKGQSLTDITSRVLVRMEPILRRLKPDLVLVHGDTTTTLGGSLASYYQKIPVGHVEAGLRTRDLYRPYPEEMNRRITDSLATLYFSPTTTSKKHLLRESHSNKNIFVTGNTVIDALFDVVKLNPPLRSKSLKGVLRKINLRKGKLVLLTAHRRENFGAPFNRIFSSVKKLSRRFPHVHWIYPVHLNPNVKKPASRYLRKQKNIHLMEPLEYSDLVSVMKKSTLVVTDSGGLQEEAPSLGKPVLVLREVTERPEAVKAGTVRLVGSNSRRIERDITRLLTDKKAYKKMANRVNPYGDGRAAIRTRQAIEWHFGYRRSRPKSFL